MLAQIGRVCFRHGWITLGAWIVALIAVFVGVGLVGPSFSDEIEIPDSETKEGFDVLDEYFEGVGVGLSGSIVFRAESGVDDPDVQEAMEELFVEVDTTTDEVTIVSPYSPQGASQIAREGPLAGQLAFASVELDSDTDQTRAGEIGQEIREIRPEVPGLEVLVGGQALSEFEPPESELIGIAFAIVILILAFGSVIAMGLPIGVAVMGVGMGLGLVTLISNVMTAPEFATTIGAMIGLGVGIDYALLIVTRYREEFHAGRSLEDALARAMDTAGRAVVFAAIVVIVSLLGLFIIGLEFVAGLAVSASTTVFVTMLASVTLLPALIGLAGERIETTRWRGLIAAGFVALALLGLGLGIQPLLIGLPIAVVVVLAGFVVKPLKREVPRRTPKPTRESFWFRLSRFVQRHAWAMAVGSAVLLLFMAWPMLSLRLGFSDEGNADPESDTRQAYDLLAEGFGPGFNGPLIAAVEIGDPADVQALERLVADIAQTPGVVAVEGPIPNNFEPPQPGEETLPPAGEGGVPPSGAAAVPPAGEPPEAAVIEIVPESSPQSEETVEVISTLREDVIPGAIGDADLAVHLTGFTAASVDFSEVLAGRTAWFIATVLVLSFLLLMVVFRSLLVPLKAVIMNALSITAAYGVTVAVFQWGWFGDLTGLEGGAPVEPFIPMMMFAVVFGLSMDYEVFLLSRIKEEYDRSGDPVNSVADGLAATARVITAAAAIMVVVFGSFLLESDRVVRMFGFGLAVAVLLDATLVRMILVPSTMALLGAKNWWLPSWLDRILPHFQIEGGATDAEVEEGVAQEPAEPGPDREDAPVAGGG